VSGDRANGIDLLQSRKILIAGNQIGTDHDGAALGLGNAANGIFINQSSSITVGGASAAGRNTISRNLASGLFVSGTGAGQDGNLIGSNFIGVGGPSGSVPIPNSNVGIILSNTNANQVTSNAVSANLLYGILLANTAGDNRISGNMIGTD